MAEPGTIESQYHTPHHDAVPCISISTDNRH